MSVAVLFAPGFDGIHRLVSVDKNLVERAAVIRVTADTDADADPRALSFARR